MGKMIEVEGFKAFRGWMAIIKDDSYISHEGHEADHIYGEWLYKPDCDCWYSGGKSYPAKICVVLEVE